MEHFILFNFGDVLDVGDKILEEFLDDSEFLIKLAILKIFGDRVDIFYD